MKPKEGARGCYQTLGDKNGIERRITQKTPQMEMYIVFIANKSAQRQSELMVGLDAAS